MHTEGHPVDQRFEGKRVFLEQGVGAVTDGGVSHRRAGLRTATSV